jgi:septum formation protein
MIDREHPLLLGSASPRRREILETLGLPLVVRAFEVDERVHAGERADDYLARVVADKLAAAVVDRTTRGGVLVADTLVLVDGNVVGKPTDDDDARAILRGLSGRAHEVWTRFALDRGEAETVRTRVVFRALSDDAIARYVATGEGRDKAGAYAIQGIGAFLVSRIEGSYSNVVGLPACEVIDALLRVGLLAAFPLTPGA